MDLEVIRRRKHSLAECERCPLYEDSGFVPTFNPHPSARIAVIGEAPGVQEERRGIPFTGPSGDLLNQVLQHHGIKREDVMISNAALCRPIDNADPPKAALEACRPRLRYELKQSGVDTIVAAGKVASHELINTKASMRKLRVGPPKKYRWDDRVQVIPTWHPAYSLRSPDSFPDLVFDFGKIRGKTESDWVEPQYRVFDTPSTAIAGLEIIRTGFDRIVVDIETGVNKDDAFVHPSEYPLLCVGIAVAPGRAVVIGENALNDFRVRDKLREVLSSTRIIAHNGKFDLAGLYNVCGKQSLWFDTMLASNCLVSGTRVLKTDLTWTTIEKLVPGDELVGFNEYFTSLVQPTKVLASKLQTAHTYKIKTPKGEIIASAGHLWPVRRPDEQHTKIEWLTTRQLFEQKAYGWRLIHFVEPWEIDKSHDGGYLAGFLDGEGNYAGGGLDNTNGSKRIQYTQNPGPVLSRVQALLKQKGFEPKLCGRPGRYAEQWELSNRQAMRLIGSVRPSRFMQKSSELWQGNRRCVPVDILSIEYVGEQEVVGLKTESNTFIAEGFLTHNCLDERPGHHGLKVLSIERLGAPDYEADIRDYVPRGGDYADIPRNVLYRYNAYDVVCTYALYELFSKEFTAEDWKKHNFIVRAANALIDIEMAGLDFDLEYNAQLAEQYQERIQLIENQIHQITGYELNPRSPKQILQYYNDQGFIPKKTEAALLEELTTKLTGDVLEFTKTLLKHRREAKLYGTYVKGLAKRCTNGKVYTTFLLHGTTSGRLASREPNLQNVVRDKPIRNQFTASSEDHCLLQCDYKQAEGRVITTLARDEYLRGIFADSTRDLFTELNNDIYGVGKHGKEERVKIKSVFYGLAYGRGNPAIAKELDITLTEANELIGKFKSLIPAVMAWQAAIKHQVLSGEDLTTPYGRKRSFWLITDRNQNDVLNEALSYKPQSIASDICLDALITLQPMLKGIAVPKLTIHDAIIVECKKTDISEVEALMRREMVASAARFTDYLPFEVDCTTGFRWGEL